MLLSWVEFHLQRCLLLLFLWRTELFFSLYPVENIVLLNLKNCVSAGWSWGFYYIWWQVLECRTRITPRAESLGSPGDPRAPHDTRYFFKWDFIFIRKTIIIWTVNNHSIFLFRSHGSLARQILGFRNFLTMLRMSWDVIDIYGVERLVEVRSRRGI